MTDKEIRHVILTVVNDNRKKSRHEHQIQMTVHQIEREVRNTGHNLSQQEVMQAVDYLRSAGMLKRTQETKTVKVGLSPGARSIARRLGTPTSSKFTSYYYTLTVKAIDLLDGETEFSKKPFEPLQNVTVNATNSAVVIGSNNAVSTHIELYQSLDELRQKLSEATELSVEERQSVLADVESLKQQLTKPRPDHRIIKVLWSGVEHAAAVAGASELALGISKVIAAMTGHPIH